MEGVDENNKALKRNFKQEEVTKQNIK